MQPAFNIPVILNIIQINDILWFDGSELRIYYLNLANQCYIKLCICYLFFVISLIIRIKVKLFLFFHLLLLTSEMLFDTLI